jgi:hypothetical protein
MMAEYYNKETLLDFIKKYTPNFGGTTSLQCVERSIEQAPTVDVVEVVHGRWIEKGYEGIMTYCSECLHRAPFNNHQELILSNYCPNCGAKMDGGSHG